MSFDKIKSMFNGDHATDTSTQPNRSPTPPLDKKAIFKDVALNDFTPNINLGPNEVAEKQIEAAQYQPFTVNYQSQSPNYDELAKEQQARVNAAEIASINDKETVAFKLSLLLFFRQLVAAFFSHTTLNIFLPQLSLRFGPCYPSSMALPYLISGAIAGALAAFICYFTVTWQLTGGFCLFFYILLSGLTAFRGLAELSGLVTRRRADSMTYGAALFLPSVLFIFILNAIFLRNEPFEGGIFFALATMLSAAFASSLSFDIKQDPVDSFGTMSLKGVLCLALIVCIFTMLIFKLTVACSILGLALLLRLIIGYYFNRHNVLASRQHICAAQLIIMLALMFDLLLLSLNHNILNNDLYTLLSAQHLIALN